MVATPERRTLRAPLRVLLVEDSENDALLLLRELRRGGYEAEHERVYTPEAMREALAGTSWDVVISDYRMPRFSASEALEIASGIRPGGALYRGLRHGRRGRRSRL